MRHRINPAGVLHRCMQMSRTSFILYACQ